MPQTAPLMTKSAYARHRGVPPSTVSVYLRQGKIAEKDGKIDWKKADKLLDSTLSKTKGAGVRNRKAAAEAEQPKARGRPRTVLTDAEITQLAPDVNGFPPGSMAYIRIKREQLLLDKQQAEFDVMVGKLVDRLRVENVVRRNIEASVKILERFPDKLAPRLAVETDQFKIRKLIQAEIVELCKELANITESFPESLTGSAQ